MDNIDKYALIISACAAAFSAFTALLSFVYSRKRSRQDMLDQLKMEIIVLVSSRDSKYDEYMDWIESLKHPYSVPIAYKSKELAKLLGPQFEKKKWITLIPVAMAELQIEGYSNFLLIPDHITVRTVM